MASETPRHRCSVLLIEDDPDVREVVRVALTSDGYEVRTAPNGREALHLLRSTASTCMIVLDIMLPVMDAAQFRAAQLRDRSLAWIPVIVLSGAVDAAEQARAIGARFLVRKPIDLDNLRGALGHVGCRCAQMPRRDSHPGRIVSTNNKDSADELATSDRTA